MKIIILGPPLAGKTTLCSFLRQNTELIILDFDEELLRLNNDVWPGDDDTLNTRLKKEVVANVLNMEQVVMFGFELSIDDLKLAKASGFKVGQISLPSQEYAKRNKERLIEQPDNDAFQYVESNIALQRTLEDTGMIDFQLDGMQPTTELAEQVLGFES